jgi:hypothetical protein
MFTALMSLAMLGVVAFSGVSYSNAMSELTDGSGRPSPRG